MIQRVARQIDEAGLNANITIAANETQLELIRSQLPGDVKVVYEPARRDTFPAIALACAHLALEQGCGEDEVVVVMPCDPYTGNGYFQTLKRMAEAVEQNAARLVLMGIQPTYPSSKYGYIVPDGGSASVRKVLRFTEKPSVEKAEELLSQGALWNGGVFAFKLGYMMELTRSFIDSNRFSFILSHYEDFPKISFDYQVAEKETSVAVVPYDGEWKDLGTWNTLTDELSFSTTGRTLTGPECKNVHIINELNLPVFADGLEDVVIAVSEDGILVCRRDRTEFLKEYVDKL